MTGDHIYPDDPAGPFEPPPRRFEDREGRPIVVREVDGSDGRSLADDREALVEMYVAFDPEDRAQGIPPTGESSIREWLGHILADEAINVVACLPDDGVVGHATLVPDGQGGYELAIFVLGDYQNAGIGTRLIEGLLGAGQRHGAEHVWLTVERWNNPAIALYRKVGFEASDTENFELEMCLRLDPDAQEESAADTSADPDSKAEAETEAETETEAAESESESESDSRSR